MSHTKPSPGPQISQLDGLWKKKCTHVQVCTCMEMNLSLLIAVMQLSVMTKYLRKINLTGIWLLLVQSRQYSWALEPWACGNGRCEKECGKAKMLTS